jgi:hypothetical protein
VVRAEDEFGRPVPDSDDDLIATKEWMKGLFEASGEAQIANLDLAGGCDHDVGGLQVTMEDPVGMQILAAVEQLEHDALDGGWWDRMARLLCVVVDDLQQVMFCVLKDHEDALVLEDSFDIAYDALVTKLAAEAHLTDGTLGDAGIANLLALLVGLELLDGYLGAERMVCADLEPTDGLVDAAICSAANKTDDTVAFGDTSLGLVSAMV